MKIESVQYITIDSEADDQRLDNYLFSKLKGVPKSHVYRLIRSGQVRVNKGRAKAHTRLYVRDIVRIPPIRISESEDLPVGNHFLAKLDNAIIYEDSDIIVVNKPTGMAVHGGSGISHGVIEIVRALKPLEKSLELVHRIDKDTSGLLLISKKRSILKKLHQCFREHSIKKTYYAVVKGRFTKKPVIVDKPLTDYERSSGERMAKIDKDGKDSYTRFELVEANDHFSLIKVMPKSGRMHQIRVHAAYLNHPVIGDPKYGNMEYNQQMKSHGFNRLMLHAEQLRLPEGILDIMKFNAPLPEVFKDSF